MHAPNQAPFEIGDERIEPGTIRDVRLAVSTMATGYDSHLAIRVIHGARPGPTIFVSGAVHGDEIVGTAIERLPSPRPVPEGPDPSVATGRAVFADSGCAACHVPALPLASTDGASYSKLTCRTWPMK